MNNKKGNLLQLILGCAYGTKAIFGRLLGNKKNIWQGVMRVALLIMLLAAPASADTLQNVLYTEIKRALSPILEALWFPLLPVAAALGVLAAAAAAAAGGANAEATKKEIMHYVVWIVIVEILLTAFWIVVKIFAMTGGKEITV